MSGPRPAKTERTRERIQRAAAELFRENTPPELITFKAVAQRAGVAEMTVYRYFPTRKELHRGLWEQLDREMGTAFGMPNSQQELRMQQCELFRTFEAMASQTMASIATPAGRAMRAASNERIRSAFLAIADEVAPHARPAHKVRVAAVLQLLHSAYAWASLREQWDLTAEAAGDATLWAIDTLLSELQRRSALELRKVR
ncbi:MAG TPA: TetR/AcrR family transcriptional regulator [Steroidobacteraceae bacterium]|nr:TetR/AcrR family transcriptional regulator [Steroidobacteraceae bacterium]